MSLVNTPGGRAKSQNVFALNNSPHQVHANPEKLHTVTLTNSQLDVIHRAEAHKAMLAQQGMMQTHADYGACTSHPCAHQPYPPPHTQSQHDPTYHHAPSHNMFASNDMYRQSRLP